MKYRALTDGGDYAFGQGSAVFLVDSPAAVGQAVKTRLMLWSGEWFLDVNEGTPYLSQIVGVGAQTAYDLAIQERILGTEGVLSIDEYASSLQERKLSVTATISTVYGSATINSRVGA